MAPQWPSRAKHGCALFRRGQKCGPKISGCCPAKDECQYGCSCAAATDAGASCRNRPLQKGLVKNLELVQGHLKQALAMIPGYAIAPAQGKRA